MTIDATQRDSEQPEQVDQPNLISSPGLESPKRRWIWVFDAIFLVVLLVGAYFRLVGINWGDYQYLHPDERFLIWVGTDISPLKCSDPALTINECPPQNQTWMGFSDYFNTAASNLNPHNRGHGFYVYGTLPMFLTRYVVEWVYGHSGFNEMTNIGRALSALADLLTLLLVYAIASRLYDHRVGVLAGAFAAATVLLIQQSHFFTMDTFLNLFIYLAIYFAVRIASQDWRDGGAAPESFRKVTMRFIRHPMFLLSLGFGVGLGCAVASKLNAAPVALMLPAAFGLQLMRLPAQERKTRLGEIIGYLVVGAVVSILVFRLFQPYAFSGPGIFGVKPNPLWVANIREQRNQAAGDVDFPPALQWARRPIWFSAQNMVLWGLGIPLGVLSWAGFLWAGWRMLADRSPRKVEIQRHALLWGWTAVYFTWQSIQFNPTMRYQLPIYPALAIFAAWAVFALYDRGRQGSGAARRVQTALAVIIGGAVLVGTVAWAFAFTRIYARPITRVAASRWIYENIPGPINLKINAESGIVSQPVSFPYSLSILPGQPYSANFSARSGGALQSVYLPHILDIQSYPGDKTLTFKLFQAGVDQPLAEARVTAPFDSVAHQLGGGFSFEFDQPVNVEENASYRLELALEQGGGAVTLSGAAPANEGDWDDGLPLRLEGYDAYGGLYQTGLNFNMYTDDNQEKLLRFLGILDRADYLLISSNRQWGSLPRLPERFPLTTRYYRELLGCPPQRSIQWCYNVAQPGKFQGSLGYDLVEVFQSDPTIGNFRINDQPAEEAFTVYDHPKVMVFKKNGAYDPEKVKEILSSVDFSQVARVTPKRAGSNPANLLLPVERWIEQQSGGTWSQLFSASSPLNRSQVLATLAWYASLLLLGWIVYPFVRLALPGLDDRGYPLARGAGLLLLAYLVWLLGSARVPAVRSTISGVLLFLLVAGGCLAYVQRGELVQEIRRRGKYFLSIEGLFLALFVIDLLIRLGNPDLWHPWKGGEKPMDFAYFNAVLKSTSFPPYDPWYAGGYLNYYYYGFVLVGMLVKWLGIVPAVAYNLIIPSLFAMISIGAFSLNWNLYQAAGSRKSEYSPQEGEGAVRRRLHPFWIGLAGAVGMGILGNLATLRMVFQGYQRLVAPGGVITDTGFFSRAIWTVQGFVKALGGAALPYSLGDWYWIPSRAIPAPGDVEPITEFPFFTVLYADLHAHLIALPITLLGLAFCLSVILSQARWRGYIGAACGYLLGGLAIGALRPTNTWDFYTYLALGCTALLYAYLRYELPDDGRSSRWIPGFSSLPQSSQRLVMAAGSILILIGLSMLLYKPFTDWYALGYNKISLWKGTHTPLSSYLTHWGLFLFLIVSWMAWETRDWLASTPLSSLRKLEPYKVSIQVGIALLLALVALLLILKVAIAWFVLPLAAWAGVLLLRPHQPDAKRFVLFLTGTGLVLTLMVETIVLVGDIGRMNTVFKFYLQVWTFFSIGAVAAFGWLLASLPNWNARFRTVWQVSLAGLVAIAALYPLLASMAKIEDRMEPRASRSLDGMDFMKVAGYADEWGVMDLSQDYRAIRWMQENVSGSPVIVEANLRNLYRWGSRFSIYTGLPGVAGWEWHQQQQRAINPGNWVSDRIAEIDSFYLTTDLQKALEFLRKYNVRYIILGQQERGHYSNPRLLLEREVPTAEGLSKFEAQNGVLWSEVYRDGDTVIYEVLQQ
jgi:YYY domain-containing protein